MRAVSSVGRASGLHPEGREFEPLTAHHFDMFISLFFKCLDLRQIDP